MHQIALPALEALVTLSPCEDPPPVPVVTTVAPVGEGLSLYLSTGSCLYAVNAANGTTRWCQQVKLTRTREAPPPPPGVSMPPPPRLSFATPRMVDGFRGANGTVYVCINGWVSYTCAFAAGDGALRWWTPTDARVASMPLMDWAVPLVRDGIVYSGSYALSEQDGSVLWRIAIDTLREGTLSLHALAGETLYASTTRGIYAVNARDGQVRWRYRPGEQSRFSGPPVVSGRLLCAGTSGSVGYPEKCGFFALDVETGDLVWRYPIDGYVGAVVHHETIYVSSGYRFLYALDSQSGELRWQRQFAAVGHALRDPATVADDVVYLTVDGVYALRQGNGEVLWHQPLGSRPGVSFGPPVILDGAVYVVSHERHGSTLHALNASNGAECWQTPYPFARGLALAQ